ncbi:MAG: hypothetical protein ACYC0Q_14705 [Eubacteriales bacterium]
MGTTVHWTYGFDQAILYSESGRVWKAARKAGLKPSGEYYRRDGVLFARQFTGDREKVAQICEKFGGEVEQLALFARYK